jgi:Fe-S-cluster containining protein
MGGPRKRGSQRTGGPGGSVAPAAREQLEELRALYARIDSALEGWGCETSTDCCRFGVTGREPYPTAVELAELERAVRARGGLPKRRSLPIADDERRCALLGDDGRCLVYAARPFGCRTFFCERARGPVGERGLPRAEIAEVGRAIAALSARFAPADPGPRPLSRASGPWEAQRARR